MGIKRPVRRNLRFAIFGNGIGPIGAEELGTAPTMRWELLRQMITDAHQTMPRKDLARCLRCHGPVYIKVNKINGVRRPFFSHYAGADTSCPWFSGRSISPDAARASQYGGAQESDIHRQLCNLIAELANADTRTEEVKVDEYLPPTANEHGRYPDVYIRWTGLTPMAIELQMSRTFQTEISARGAHYNREGMPLIWVLCGIDLDDENEIPQSFNDVLLRHRGNAFFLDQAAIEASRAQDTLVLSYRLRNSAGKFEPARQVRVDQLTFPPCGLPFVEDRITPSLLTEAEQLRQRWIDALATRNPSESGSYIDLRSPEWDAAFSSIQADAPLMASWLRDDHVNKEKFAALIAVTFSIVTYAQGNFTNYATAQPNIVAMLNSRIPTVVLGPYAFLLRAVIKLSSASNLLGGTVGNHMQRAVNKFIGRHCLQSDPEWQAMAILLPELFNHRLRAELAAVGAWPTWMAAYDPDDRRECLYVP